MDKVLLEQRLHQLFAVDKNAFDIYTDLAKIAPDHETKAAFLALAADENRHCELESEILALLVK